MINSPLDVAPVIPVVVIDDVAQAVPLARALVAGGLPIIEVTLRTAAGLDAVRAIASEVPEMVVGTGTIASADQVKPAVDAGSQFLVSPGSTDRLLDALLDSPLPFLAGCAGPSDVLRLHERGVSEAKLFPAEVVGGVAMLKALAGPFGSMRFCPTGGITLATAPNYLSLPNVGCVGGTWLAPSDLLVAQDWSGITERARAATLLR